MPIDDPSQEPLPTVKELRLTAMLSGIRSQIEREEDVVLHLTQAREVIVSLLPLLPSPEAGSVKTTDQVNAQIRIRNAFQLAEQIGDSFFLGPKSDKTQASIVGLGRAKALKELTDVGLITPQEESIIIVRSYSTTERLASLLQELRIIRKEHENQIYR